MPRDDKREREARCRGCVARAADVAPRAGQGAPTSAPLPMDEPRASRMARTSAASIAWPPFRSRTAITAVSQTPCRPISAGFTSV